MKCVISLDHGISGLVESVSHFARSEFTDVSFTGIGPMVTKLAITGKGGVGKSTFAGLCARYFRDNGKKVILIDADPDMNMGSILGIPPSISITPIIELKELIAERTETTPGQAAPFYKMNPRVDDVIDDYSVMFHDIRFLVMGTIKSGGGGCACPENAFLKQLLGTITFLRDEVAILDMEAGIEHLGRGTAQSVDQMIVVVEPNKTSLETAFRIKRLTSDLKIKNLAIVGNKIRCDKDRDFISSQSDDIRIAGFLDYSDDLMSVSRGERDLFSLGENIMARVGSIISGL